MEELIKENKLPNFTPFEILGRMTKKQKLIKINGIDIYFPYEVYPNQIKYMEKVIELLNKNINRDNYTNIGALESPTGTGKTLCLLCSTLAWMNEMRRQKKFGGKIIYTTRTHSQITQIIHELRKTCYWPRTAVLASRDKGCVNEKIRQNLSGTILNIKCRKFNGTCPYYNGVLQDKREKNNCLDIESLFINGKKQTFCPFYQQIESAKSYSDIIFMPYNYIFDEEINKTLEIDIENNIIIIDEAHNLRQVCEDSKSVDIKETDFDDIISDIEKLLSYNEKEQALKSLLIKEEKKKSPFVEISKQNLEIENQIIKSIKNKLISPKFKIENGGKILNYLEFFEIFISKEEIKNKKKKKKIIYKNDSGDSIMPSIPKNITISNIEEHIQFLVKVEKAFQELYEKGTKISILIKILYVISELSKNITNQNFYTFFMDIEEKIQKNNDSTETIKKIKKINIFCFSPQLEFSDILKSNPYSIIFTSGTLSPFKILEDELQIKFDITLENQHIVPIDQFKFDIVTDYSENGKYRFDYNNRNTSEMIIALGNQIFNYCQQTPVGGILVFFPSYYYLNQCKALWHDSGINNKIRQYKQIFIDSPKDKTLINEIKQNSNKNYIFFSVFRGSCSEGIDFSDDYARMVICVGIPFASLIEKKIKLKIDYLNEINRRNKNFIGGNEWYLVDAMTAVNQSLGRIIRHINDYGVMICIDERYTNFYNYFSFWIRENYEKYKNENNYSILDFFNEQRAKFKNINLIKPRKNIRIDFSNKSGFNSTIVFDNDIFNSENLEKEKNDKIYNNYLLEEKSLSSSEEDNNNLLIVLNKDNRLDKKENIEEILDLSKFNIIAIEKVDIENEEKELDEIKTEIKKIELMKKREQEQKLNASFEKCKDEGNQLLQILNEFIINNPKGFNNIVNKYK